MSADPVSASAIDGTWLLEVVRGPDFEPPLLPDVATRVLRMLTQPDVDFQELARLVSSEPLLAAQLIRVASSPLYGNQEIGTVVSALIRLGNRTVRNVVLEYGLKTLRHSQLRFQAEVKAVIDHCVVTANLMHIVSGRTGITNDGFFTLGLLHDLGLIAVLSALNGVERQELMRADWNVLSQISEEALSQLIKAWSLPVELGRVLDDYFGAASSEKHVLLVASALADGLGFQSTPDAGSSVSGLESSLEALKLGESDFEAMLEEAKSAAS